MASDKDAKIMSLAIAHATGSCNTAAWATANGVPLSTAYRWSRKPKFRAFVERARADLIRTAVQKLAAGATGAVDTLVRIYTDPDAKHGDQIAASVAILTHIPRLDEHANLTETVAALEAARARREKGGRK